MRGPCQDSASPRAALVPVEDAIRGLAVVVAPRGAEACL